MTTTSGISLGRKILFSLLPLTALLTLLVIAEFGLRLFSPVASDSLVTEATYDGIQWYQINRSYLWRYFPANSPIIPELRPTLIRKVKPVGGVRIMCLGESSMFGTPYEMAATIPAIIRKQLRHMYPGRDIEVINWGASAINSNVIHDLSPQIAALQPDVIVIYTGHNEYYGPSGISANRVVRSMPWLIPLTYRFRELRLTRLVESFLNDDASVRAKQDDRNLMRQVSEEHLVELVSDDSRWVSAQFERNLTEIIDIFQKEGIKVIFSDVSSNLFFPPFVSRSEFAAERNNFERWFAGGSYDSIVAVCGRILKSDPTHPLGNYWLGRTLVSRGLPDSGIPYLTLARDNDLLKFRAPSVINDVIRRVCEREATPCIGADSVLTALSVADRSGNNYFSEHLHGTAKGYYSLANLFVEMLANVAHFRELGRRRTLPFDFDSLSIPWLDVAYADRSIQHLTGRWPFDNYHRTPVVLGDAASPLRGIVEDVYARRIGWDEGCYRSASYFWKQGKYREAQTAYEALIESHPPNFYARYLLGSLLNQTGHPEEAIMHYEVSVRSNPDYPNAHLDLGLLYVNKGKSQEAIRELQTVLNLAVGSTLVMRANAYYGLAAAHANEGDIPQALENISRALALVPNYSDALTLRQKISTRSKGRSD